MNTSTVKQLSKLMFRLQGKNNHSLSIKKIFLLVIFLTILIFAKYSYETSIARPQMSYMGVPKSSNDWQNLTHTLRNDAFMVGYSEKLANPLWVTYKVTQSQQSYGKRPGFQTDWRTFSRVESSDYKSTGYDRGHLAPNYVIASRYGTAAQKQTFLMTNISPQKPKFNQKIWQRLEEVSADHFSKRFAVFWVVTGPIFSDTSPTLKNTHIAIPKAFYKIFVVPPETPDKAPLALAFIIPQTAKPKDSLLKYVVTIDEIETQTGIDFFWQLEDNTENKMEAHINHQNWQLAPIAKLPSRY